MYESCDLGWRKNSLANRFGRCLILGSCLIEHYALIAQETVVFTVVRSLFKAFLQNLCSKEK